MGNRKPRFQHDGDVIYFDYADYQPAADGQLIFVWDIDKTYLDTRFETLRGLIKTAFEKAFQKVNVPGAATLIRALVSAADGAGQAVPLYFISASPPQIEAKIYQKMQIDRLKPFGIFFKDNLKNFRPKRFKRLKQQVGYKVQALLQLRLALKKDVKMIMFGDDSESDAVVYCLFSDICKRRLPQQEIASVLEALHVLPDQRRRIFDLQSKINAHDPVEKIYINLVTDTDPDYYAKFGRRVLATFTTFQAALDLYQDGRIDDESLKMVARDMITNYGFTPEELAKSVEDLHKRGFLKSETMNRTMPFLKEAGLLPASFTPPFHPAKALQKIGEKLGEALLGIDAEDPWIVEHIDYLNDFR